MGNSNQVCSLTKDEIQQFMSTTVFNSAEIRALWLHFQTISNHTTHITRS